MWPYLGDVRRWTWPYLVTSGGGRGRIWVTSGAGRSRIWVKFLHKYRGGVIVGSQEANYTLHCCPSDWRHLTAA